jgi:hypothetical protein
VNRSKHSSAAAHGMLWSCIGPPSAWPTVSKAASASTLTAAPLLPLHLTVMFAVTFLGLRSGFCKHRGPDFGPWHRAYMRMFEDALIKACHSVAGEHAFLDDVCLSTLPLPAFLFVC